MDDLKKVFYTLNHVLSYTWAWLIVLIGARRRGKTFSVKKWLVNRFVYHNEQFVIWRDTEDECKLLCEKDGVKFWQDLTDKCKKFKNLKIVNISNTVYINDKIAGFIMPVTLFHKLKGSQYERVKNGLYDEFIREKNYRYNGDRGAQFLNMLLTVSSYRSDFKMILTANALDKGDTILSDILGFNISSFGIYKNKQKGIILDYIPNSDEFLEYQKQGNSYKLIKGTRYEANLIGNEFIDNTDGVFYDKRKPCDLIGIYYNRDKVAIRIYQAKNGDEYYAGKDINPNTANYMRFTFDLSMADNRIRFAGIDEKNMLKELYKNNLILFENKYILNVFKDIIK